MTAARRLYLLGALLCVAMLLFARAASSVGGTFYLVILGIAAILYLLVIREFARTSHYSRRTIWTCLLLGTAWQIPFFVVAPGPQDDVLRYVWDGRLQRLGYNPYQAVPSDPALDKLHTAETRSINNPDVPSPYPAGAQLFFRAVTSVSESPFAFKVALALCHFAIIASLLIELTRMNEPHWVLAYAWHPLLVTCVFYNSHIDTLGVLLLVISAGALRRGKSTIAALAFGLAVAVKFLPIVLAPLYWRRVRILDAVYAAAMVFLLYLPFLHSGPLPAGSLGVFVQRFRFNDPVFGTLSRLLSPQTTAALAIVCGLATALWIRLRHSTPSWQTWGWPLAASLICLPVIYPWYLLWLVPFLRTGATLTLMIWTLTILSVFYVWHSYHLGQPWQVPGWLLAVEFGPVALAVCTTTFHPHSREASQI